MRKRLSQRACHEFADRLDKNRSDAKTGILLILLFNFTGGMCA